MLHQEFDPPEELRDVIKCFWYNKKNFGKPETSYEVVPDGYCEIIFYFGTTLTISTNGSLELLPSPFIMGLQNQPVIFHAKNCLEIIGIRCYPWTMFDLLELPSGKNKLQSFEHPIAKLQSTLNELIYDGKIVEAITLVKKYFLETPSPVSDRSTLSKAGSAMLKANGTLPVSQVAASAHATVRTLERKFKHSSGYSVKDVSGLMRFEKVRNHLWLHPDSNIAGVAHEFGYSDQSHLSKEFKRYSGMTPAVFVRKTRKQIADTNFVAFIQS